MVDTDQYSVALRESGSVDIYFNRVLLDSSETCIGKCEDHQFEEIDLDFDQIYFRGKNNETYTILLNKESTGLHRKKENKNVNWGKIV